VITTTPRKALAAALAAGALLTGCAGTDGTDDAPATGATSEEEVPHGYVAGAEETAEPQYRLVVADSATGAVGVVDLTTEETHPADPVDGVEGIATDGRFAFLRTPGAVHVVDSGAWSVDHGDHVHYYRTAPGTVGAVDGDRPAGAHTDTAVTALSFGDGSVQLLDREALEEGRLSATATIEGGTALPHAGHLLLAAGDSVTVTNRDGTAQATVGEPCADATAEAVTRRGALFGCADGALLVDAADDGTFTGERIPYPHAVQEEDRAREFTRRAGSDTLTAPAGETGVWVLDVTERAWTLLETGPVSAVNAVGDGTTVLALTADGVLHAYDQHSGAETASRALLTELTEPPAAPVIEIDTGRAYVNDPAARAVHEIDYNDDLRLARTFALDLTPDLMVETGR
jgi:hypothetical protein